MNKTKGLRPRSKRTKQLIIAAAMATAVGGFGVAVTLPASAADQPSGSFCVTTTCSQATPEPETTPEPEANIIPIRIKSSTREDALDQANGACTNIGGRPLILNVFSEGDVWYVDGDCYL